MRKTKKQRKKIANTEIIVTGGTIDSYYEITKDTVVPNEESVVPRYLNDLNLHETVKTTVVAMKDSRDLTKTDRNKVVKAIESSKARNLIVTHGTYTMPDTARYLSHHLKNKSKVIILTGSMKPLKGFDLTDASFNLGFAMGVTPHLEPGIYVCMNGRVFAPEEVVKSMYEGRFDSVL